MSKEYKLSDFKAGQRIVCVDNKRFEKYLTLEKNYTIFEIHTQLDGLCILSDDNNNRLFTANRFIPLSVFRLQKLNKLYETV